MRVFQCLMGIFITTTLLLGFLLRFQSNGSWQICYLIIDLVGHAKENHIHDLVCSYAVVLQTKIFFSFIFNSSCLTATFLSNSNNSTEKSSIYLFSRVSKDEEKKLTYFFFSLRLFLPPACKALMISY